VPGMAGTPIQSIQVSNARMSSMMNMSQTALLEMFRASGEALGYTPEALAKVLGEPTEIKVSKKVVKADKKPRANAGLPTLHGAWSKHVIAAHCPKDGVKSEEFNAFLAKRVASAEAGEMVYTAGQGKVKSGKKAVGDRMDAEDAKGGAHTAFVAFWKTEHPELHSAFKAEWDIANPKDSRASSVAEPEEEEAEEAEEAEVKPAPKKRGPKKLADMTAEERAAHDAKKATKKAAKEVTEEVERVASVIAPVAPPAPVEVEPEPEVAEDSLMPFIHKKVKYLRFGHLDDDNKAVWDEGNDLWKLKADGSKGDYAGQLLASGEIDSSAEVLANEPAIE